MCVSLCNNNNNFGYTQTFRKRGTRGQQPFHPHTRRSATEEAGRGLETYHESWLKYILGPHEFLVHQSVTHPDSRIETETQRSWTWRRRSLSIFSRNYLRWTEEPSRLHRHRRDRRKVQPSPPYRGQPLHQHIHRWVIYVCMYFTPNRPFSLLQGAVKHFFSFRGPCSRNNWPMGLASSGRFPAELYQSTALSIPPHTNYQGYPIRYYKVLIQTIVTPSLQYRWRAEPENQEFNNGGKDWASPDLYSCHQASTTLLLFYFIPFIPFLVVNQVRHEARRRARERWGEGRPVSPGSTGWGGYCCSRGSQRGQCSPLA